MILIKSQRKMEPAPSELGKALLIRIAENNPEMAQNMSNYFYYGIINSLHAMIKDSNPDPDFEYSQDGDNAIQEIIMATRNFMEEYIKIYEKYVYDN